MGRHCVYPWVPLIPTLTLSIHPYHYPSCLQAAEKKRLADEQAAAEVQSDPNPSLQLALRQRCRVTLSLAYN